MTVLNQSSCHGETAHHVPGSGPLYARPVGCVCGGGAVCVCVCLFVWVRTTLSQSAFNQGCSTVCVHVSVMCACACARACVRACVREHLNT